MIILLEPWSVNHQHYQFNINMLKVVSKIYIDKKIIYFGDKKQILKLKENININNIEFQSIKIPNKNILYILKILYTYIRIKMKCIMRKEKLEKFILLNSHSINLFYSKIFFKNINSIFIIHGNLEEIKKRKRFYEMGYYNKVALKFLNSKSKKYLVLGSNIERNLENYLPEIKNNVISIEHPFEFDKIETKKVRRKEIKIASIGNASIEKGSDKIYLIEEKIDLKKVKLEHIGKWENIKIKENTTILGIKNKKSLSLEEYKAKIRQQDYILFLYPKELYELTASGAIFDAINAGIPIIAIRNNYFEHIFQLMGSIGYLCDSIDEVIDIINSISKENDISNYSNQVSNIVKNRKKFENEAIIEKIMEKKLWDFI